MTQPMAEMTTQTSTTVFSLRTANAMLPLVRSITRDVVELSAEVANMRQRLHDLGADALEGGTDGEQPDLYSTELDAIRESTERQSDRIKQCVAELTQLNVWPRSLLSGYVDFPAVREGKDVCLCWRLGEPEVMYWHHADEPCSSRRLADLSLIRQSGNISD